MSIATTYHGHLEQETLAVRVTPAAAVSVRESKHFLIYEREVSYRFYTHFHPYVNELVRRLLRDSVTGLQAADTDYVRKPDGSIATLPDGKTFKPVLYSEFFAGQYAPTALVTQPQPVEDLDFTTSGAYSLYNWELFFHVPFSIAVQLSKNQRYEDAQRWFHLVFDPTDASDTPAPARFWKVRPFQSTHVRKIEELLENLSVNADPQLREDTIRSIEAWKDAPFRPHVVARFRQQAYMFNTVMAYLDNLIAWGDSLFRQDTGEAIDEARMIYVLAANILGPRPLAVPKKGSMQTQTYATLRKDLDAFGNALREVEPDLPFDLMPVPAEGAPSDERITVLRSIGKSLYFGVPRNDKLLGYWDTVADRLFKIRNSLNLQGVFRQLPLFEPPIDPAMLVRATAAGLDVGAIVNGLRQPLPLVRFPFLLQKSLEICQEVKTLGANLLSAIEKEDAEALSILRAQHERTVLGLAEAVKYTQWQESVKAKEALQRTLESAVQKYTYHQRKLGKTADEIKKAIPEMSELAADGLLKFNFSAIEPVVATSEVIIDNVDGEGKTHLNPLEKSEMDSSHSARDWAVRAGTTATIAGLSHYIPEFGFDLHFWGMGAHMELGGKHIGPAFTAISEFQKGKGSEDTYDSGHAGKMAGYSNREQEWNYQSNLAALEVMQIYKQIRAAQIREAVAKQEFDNQQRVIKNAQEIEFFLTGETNRDWKYPNDLKQSKTANRAHYAWTRREVKVIYSQCFQLAFDTGKKAERTLQLELGQPGARYLEFSYLAGKEGLLAGEKLYLDLKRMELAFHELNRREFELTKHVSLMQLDPMALMELRTTGSCTIRVPESAFDIDGPGHYFRRIKTVAVSTPCVAGPYTSVNCTLTLVRSSIRVNPTLGERPYAPESPEDDRFDHYFGSMQSIVTSSGQNDSGLFETNLRDERYLPFEGSGAISEWRLELPADPRKGDPQQFDYDSISDVILHIRYTAREGGALLRRGALDQLNSLIETAEALGSARLFSVRHDFPSAWANFINSQSAPGNRFELTLNFRAEQYPFWSQGRLKSVLRTDLAARRATPTLEVANVADRADLAAKKATLAKESLGNIVVARKMGDVGLKTPTGEFKLFFDDNKISDLWVAVSWSSVGP